MTRMSIYDTQQQELQSGNLGQQKAIEVDLVLASTTQVDKNRTIRAYQNIVVGVGLYQLNIIRPCKKVFKNRVESA